MARTKRTARVSTPAQRDYRERMKKEAREAQRREREAKRLARTPSVLVIATTPQKTTRLYFVPKADVTPEVADMLQKANDGFVHATLLQRLQPGGAWEQYAPHSVTHAAWHCKVSTVYTLSLPAPPE